MDGAALLLLPPGLEIDRICAGATALTVSITARHPTSTCPLCGTSAARIHSRYHRTVADVTCGGRQVRLLLTVRKFFCDTPDCARKIFTERLGPFLEPWARMTTRLAQALFDIGRATCGKLGARLAARLSMPTSWKTILRRIMAVPTPPVGPVTQLGLDDWSFHRRKQFGAIGVESGDPSYPRSLARPLGTDGGHLDAGASRNRAGQPGSLQGICRRCGRGRSPSGAGVRSLPLDAKPGRAGRCRRFTLRRRPTPRAALSQPQTDLSCAGGRMETDPTASYCPPTRCEAGSASCSL
jgi:hypothetical protein